MIISSVKNSHQTLRQLYHDNCVVCGCSNENGLGLRFETKYNGEVVAIFDCSDCFQGYPSTLHGGVISSLLDGAMTNCLFAHGKAAMTGELKVRFRHPVTTDCKAVIRAWIENSYPPLHFMKAELTQGGLLKAKAEAKFVERGNNR